MSKKKPEIVEPQNNSPERAPEIPSEINDISSQVGEPGSDNLAAAVDASLGELTVSGQVVDGELADAQVLVRLPGWMRDEWQLAAERVGVSRNQFVRDAVNVAVEPLLRCVHPRGARLSYPWSETCTLCGVRLRG